jgi:chromosome segregation ATPase
VADGVRQRHASLDERRAMLRMDISTLESVMEKCDREEERWRKAYAAEVIDVGDLKGYLQEITTRRQELQAQQQALRAQLDKRDLADAQADALVAYCVRLPKRYQGLSFEEERLVLELLDIQVTREPGELPKIRGSAPFEIAEPQADDSVIATIASRLNGTCNN